MNRKLLFNTFFVLSAVGVGIAFSVKPWQIYREQRAFADASVKEMHKAEKNRAELMENKAKYESAIGKEELARTQGYRKEGETPVELEKPVVAED